MVGIMVGALLIRAFVAVGLGDIAEPVSGAYDQVSYDALAQRVLQGHGFSFPSPWYPFTMADQPTAHWSFLYTLYVAAVYGLFGHHPLVARLIQAIFSVLICWLIYRIGRRLFGEWVGLAAAALAALYGYLIFFSAALMTQTYYILFLLLALALALDIANGSAAGTLDRRALLIRWLALGAVLGIGALFRQTLLLFTLLLFAWLWWVGRSSRSNIDNSRIEELPKRTLSPLLGMLMALLVVAAFILPWTIRNYLVYQDFLLLNSNSGFWFYSSNHPNQGTNFNPNYVAPIPENLVGLPEPAIDRALLGQALNFIVHDPMRFILLTLNRTKDYFWIFPSEQSSLVSNLGRVFSFTLYLPFMLYGLVLSRQHWRECSLLYLYPVFDTTLCLVSWAAPRYRLPSDAIMMVFAGLAVVNVAKRLDIPRKMLQYLAPGVRTD